MRSLLPAVIRRVSSSTLYLAIALAGLTSSALAAPGTPLPTPNLAVPSSIFGLAPQADGAAVIVGTFGDVGGTPRTGLARVKADGTLDAAFTPTPSTAYLFSSAIQTDGRIVLGGFFTTMNGVARRYLARVDAAGTLDTTLDPGFSGFVRTVMVQTNGQIVCSGNFATVQPNGGAVVNRLNLARFNADGTLDSAFDPAVDSGPQCIAQQSDGKLLVCGDFSSFAPNGGPRVYNLGYLRRLNTDGTVDGTFTPPPFNGVVSSIAIDAAGKILVGGQFTPYQTQTQSYLLRLNADGSPDSTFSAGVVGVAVTSIAVQASGQIMVGGLFSSVGGAPRANLARVNASGAVDASFFPNPDASTYLSLLGNGQIYAAGEFGNIAGVPRIRLARLENDLPSETLSVTSSSRVQWLRGGTLPEVQAVNFELSTDGGNTWTPLGAGTRISGGWERTGLSLPGSGQVRATALVAGSYNNASSGVVRTVETFPFVAPSIVVEQPANSPLVSNTASIACGSVIVSDSSAPFVFTVRNAAAGDLKRLLVAVDGAHARDFIITQMPVTTLANGTSTTFSVVFNPRALGARTAALHIGSNDATTPSFNIALTGTGLPSNNANLAALTNSVKAFTPAFSSGNLGYTVTVPFGTSNVVVTPTAAQADATIRVNNVVIASGAASAPITLNPDSNTINIEVTAQDGVTIKTYTLTVTRRAAVLAGDIDQTFTHFVNGEVSATAFQPDGKMIVAGLLQGIDGDLSTYYGILRFNTDGSVDTGFDPRTFGNVDALLVLPSGKIVIGGGFNSVNPNGTGAVPRNNLALLNADGTLDPTFDPNVNGSVFSLSLEPDGDILVAGIFTSLQPNGAAGPTTRNHLARIRASGTLDTTFNPNANATVFHVNVQPDGLIMVGGDFTTIAGGNRSRVARLQANGTLDTTFNYAVDATVFTTFVQPDGQILVGSNRPNGSVSPRLARVSATGTVDSTFDPQISSSVRTLTMQANGQILIGGVFTVAGSTTRLRVARLNSDGTVDAGFDPMVEGSGAAVHSLMIRGDGKIMMGGYFATVGGLPRQSLARLENLTAATQSIAPSGIGGFEWQRSGSVPEAVATTFELSTDGGTNWTLLGPGTRVAGGWQITGLTGLPVSGLVRGHAVIAGGRFGGSSGLVSFQTPYTLPAPQIAVEQPAGNPLTDGDPDPVDFGTLGAGVSRILSFKISNIGGQPLTGLRVSFDGPNAAMFTVIDDPVAPLDALESTPFTVQARLTGTGAKTATMLITSNDPGNPVFEIKLAATAAAASAPVAITLAATDVTVTTAALNGTVDAKGSPRAITFEYGTTTAYGSTVTANPATLATTGAAAVSAAVTGLLPHTLYRFRVRADGDLGIDAGTAKTFTTGNTAPVAVADTIAIVPPVATLDVLGNDTDADQDNATFKVTAKSAVDPKTAGTLALSGGKLIFTASATFTGASFTYTMEDGFGATATASVTLTGGTMNIAPLSNLNVPAAGATYPVTVTATGAWAVSDALSWVTVTPAEGDASTTSVSVTVAPNTAKTARSGKIKIGGVEHSITQLGVGKPVIGPMVGAPYAAIVAGAFTLPIPTQNGPVDYTASNLPPGLSLSDTTGIISGIPTKAGSYDVTVKGKNAFASADATLTFKINVADLATGTVGTFHGLVDRHPVLNGDLASRIQLTTTPGGGYTGKLITGTTATSLKGQLTAAVGAPTLARLVLPLPDLGATLDLTLDDATDTLSGTLSDGGTNTATVQGWRNSWADVADNAADFAAIHSFHLEQPEVADDLPRGYGFGSFVVKAKTGDVTIGGTLADGTPFTTTTFIGQSGQVLIYVPLYASRGSLVGKLTITAGNSAPSNNTIAGAPDWMKPDPLAKSKELAYRAGFNPIPLTALGGTYTPPDPGARVLALPAANLNAQLSFSLGGLAASFGQALTIANPKASGLTNTATIATPVNGTKVAKFSATSGGFEGEFTIPGASTSLDRKALFSGQIVTTALGTKGYGFFLLPKVPVSSEAVKASPKLSGVVVLDKP